MYSPLFCSPHRIFCGFVGAGVAVVVDEVDAEVVVLVLMLEN